MKRTTILADEELLLEAKYLAAQQGKTLTGVIHEALRDYVQSHRQPRKISFAGMGHSGDPSISQRIDEILKSEIDPIEGWSPKRRAPMGEDVATG